MRVDRDALIDRSESLRFTFDGKTYSGFHGDTLASALLANGVHLVARSFKHHRPRGIMTAGPEEPNAIVEVGTGSRREPNCRATMVELYDGLVARPQNCWPSLAWDVGALNNAIAAFIPAGFYYKTFMRPASWWEPVYERFLRRAAGLGVVPQERDPARYEHRHRHFDLVVVGAGPAGLAAALAAAHGGVRLLLVDDQPQAGGSLKRSDGQIDGKAAKDWIAAAIATLASMPNVTLLTRTTAFGLYDHRMLALAERVTDHHAAASDRLPRQRLWFVRARKIILACGAIERPLVFGGNDRPGIMLASAARTYLNHYAVRPGQRAVVFTNNDSAYATAIDLLAAGVDVAAVVDVRAKAGPLAGRAAGQGIPILHEHFIVATRGRKRVRAGQVLDRTGTARRWIDCDVICSSGGWNPTVHLHSQSGGRTRWDAETASFAPVATSPDIVSVGAAAATFDLAGCLRDGTVGAHAVLCALGKPAGEARPPRAAEEQQEPILPTWDLPPELCSRQPRYVDFQNDVTCKDIRLAHRENFTSPEHLKRYTTLGMGTDQGKTSNVLGLGLMAGHRNVAMAEIGATTFRPPYTPVALGLFAGRDIGARHRPPRECPLHEWHRENGAQFDEAQSWLRPSRYLRPGENASHATEREVLAMRTRVGMIDQSFLGKIEIRGPDAAMFLDRMYVNDIGSIPVDGVLTAAIMLREDGFVLERNEVEHLAPDHFLIFTANEESLLKHLEYYANVIWPEWKVLIAPASEQWACFDVTGPDRNGVFASFEPQDRVDAAAVRRGAVDGIPAFLTDRAVFGEGAVRVRVASDRARHVWQALLQLPAQPSPCGAAAYGVMRIEAGEPSGNEITGRVTLQGIDPNGLGPHKDDFVGRILSRREALNAADRERLVRIASTDGKTVLREGAHIVAANDRPMRSVGVITSSAWSPTFGKPIALALIAGGAEIEGRSWIAASPITNESVDVSILPASSGNRVLSVG